jgi:hypothetical protein
MKNKLFIKNTNVLEMKTIIISESQLRKTIVESELGIEKTYPVNPSIVLMVKKFLDDNFTRGSVEKLDDNGRIAFIPVAALTDKMGNKILDKTDKDLFYFLEDEFKDTFASEDERTKVLRQIIKDWYNKKISDNGLLSVVHC